MGYLQISIRSIFFYFIIVLVYKIMGKREVGELSIVDLVVSLLLSQLIAISIENYEDDVIIYLIPIFILVTLQVLVSILYLKNRKTRETLDGKQSIIISRGKVKLDEMKKQKYNLDDLLTALREKEIKSIGEVDFAILETNGKLSIFRKSESDKRYPLPVIQNGEIEEDVLFEINKKKSWLLKQLESRQIDLKNVFYCFYQNNNLYIIENDHIKWQNNRNINYKIIMVILWKN